MEFEVGLEHGHQAHLGGGRRMGLVDVAEGHDGGPPEVVVFVKDDSERDLTLHPGDTFRLGTETWKLDRVEAPGAHNLTAVFARIE